MHQFVPRHSSHCVRWYDFGIFIPSEYYFLPQVVAVASHECALCRQCVKSLTCAASLCSTFLEASMEIIGIRALSGHQTPPAPLHHVQLCTSLTPPNP